MNGLPTNSLILLGLIIGLGFLQIKLSKNNNKYLGLILPGGNLIISIITILFFVMQVVSFDSSVIIGCLIIFIAYNIPTVIFLAIYYFCRKKLKNMKELDKMNIQDLD